MKEFEIIYKTTGNHDFLYGYSIKDLHKRYPNKNFDEFDIVYIEYID